MSLPDSLDEQDRRRIPGKRRNLLVRFFLKSGSLHDFSKDDLRVAGEVIAVELIDEFWEYKKIDADLWDVFSRIVERRYELAKIPEGSPLGLEPPYFASLTPVQQEIHHIWACNQDNLRRWKEFFASVQAAATEDAKRTVLADLVANGNFFSPTL